MQIIKRFFNLIVFLSPFFAYAQSTSIDLGDASSHFIERLDIKARTNQDLILSTNKPYNRKIVTEASKIITAQMPERFSKVDQYNLQHLLLNNIEWAKMDSNFSMSRKPILKLFYKEKANFLTIRDKDFFMTIDPVIQYTESKESGNNENLFLNTRGVKLRGMISNQLGFDAFLTDNQERGPSYFEQRVTSSGYDAVPGAGYYKNFKATGFDYFENRASIYFKAVKHIDLKFGYDRNFIGDGYRSLFLSDYSAPYLFLKFDVRIWKLNYETIYMELINQHQRGDYQYPKKYSVIHHLNVDVFKWLNIGLFENVMYSRPDHYDFSYLNPVIFLVSAQQQNGSPDKTTVGLDFKANVSHSVQFYGQLLFNEFVFDQIIHYNRGWWANKQGLQLGAKYIDAFKIKNLDLQLEGNIVRPFTYTHNDTVSNYSNYNQPLAHPLGANFDEIIAIARYQPIAKLQLEAKLIAYKQGLDSAGQDFGSNIFINYNDRPRDYGFKVGSGVPANCVLASFTASYEVKNNLFVDLSFQKRNYSVSATPNLNSDASMITIGVRLNASRRMYDY